MNAKILCFFRAYARKKWPLQGSIFMGVRDRATISYLQIFKYLNFVNTNMLVVVAQ